MYIYVYNIIFKYENKNINSNILMSPEGGVMFHRNHLDFHYEFNINEFIFFLILSKLTGATIAFIIIYLF